MPGPIHHHPASYRDPAGYMFEKDGVLYRQVNQRYREHYDHFTGSGLYDELVKKGWLIPHETIHENLSGDPEAYLTLRPEKVAFVSYPYEWSFQMLKDAALLTLHMLRNGIAYGMILKDATPYNILFHKGRPVFIDSLSFEKYGETKPWIAYRQYCENFLAPLLLAHYARVPVPRLLLAWSEGVPLELAHAWLPWHTRFSLHTYLHIHLHAKYSARKKENEDRRVVFSKQKLLNLVSSLELLVKKLKLPPASSAWSHYYEEASQREHYLEEKKAILLQWLPLVSPLSTAADLGANTGVFAQLLAARGIQTLAADMDPWCIDQLYVTCKETGEERITPVVQDLAMPSPAIGVNNEERACFSRRAGSDLVLALALLHHLAIGKNIPLDKIAAFFRDAGRTLVIEFVPKTDPKVQLLLAQKADIYDRYTEAEFQQAFSRHFTILDKKEMAGSGRTLYLMQAHES